jgi:hypothetical protein
VIADLHNLQFIVGHALGFSVLTSRLLVTDPNTETSASNHGDVFLPFLVQSPWNFGTQLQTLLASSGLMLCNRDTDKAENTVLLLRSTDQIEKASHVMAISPVA